MPNVPPSRTLLGVAAVAEILDCDTTTVHRLIRKQLLPAAKMPGLRGPYLIDRADLDAYITRTAQRSAS